MEERVRILVLEDDQDLREQLHSALEEEGYLTVAVGQGAEAVELASQGTFDLVVADIRMKGMSGLDALAEMRASQPDIRSLVVTGYSTEADSIRAIQLGVGDYLKKPFRLEAFLESVARLVARSREEKRVAARESRLRQTAIWAMEQMVRLGLPAPDVPLVGQARLASRLCQVLGLDAPTSDQTQMAVLLAGLQRQREDLDLNLNPLGPGLRQFLSSLLDELDRPDGEQPSLALQSALLALGEESSRLQPVVEARGRLLAAPEATGPDAFEASRRQRGLLSLARALAGTDAARQAYETVLQLSAEPGPETGEALLGLAWTALAQGRSQEARDWARQAWEMGARLSPGNQADVNLEAALLLAELGQGTAAVDLLRQASARFRELSLEGRWAAAQLALYRMQAPECQPESALSLLLQPQHRDELAQAASWLVPDLLERPPLGGERHVLRLCQGFPREIGKSADRLSSAARLRAVQALAGQKAVPAAQEVLERLSRDQDREVAAAALRALGEEGQAALPILRIYSLGAFELFQGDERVPDREFRSQNVRFLTAYLASQAGRAVAVDVLVECFWPEDAEKGRKNVHWATSTLRRLLKPAGWQGEAEYIIRNADSLQLNPDLPRWHDYEELERALQQAGSQLRQGHAREAAASVRRALLLHRGPYLEGCFMDWALSLRTRLETQLHEACLQQVNLWRGQEALEPLLEFSQAALRFDPCCQEANVNAMFAYTASGRPEAALRHFEKCRKALKNELGLEPSIDLLREQQRALLAG